MVGGRPIFFVVAGVFLRAMLGCPLDVLSNKCVARAELTLYISGEPRGSANSPKALTATRTPLEEPGSWLRPPIPRLCLKLRRCKSLHPSRHPRRHQGRPAAEALSRREGGPGPPLRVDRLHDGGAARESRLRSAGHGHGGGQCLRCRVRAVRRCGFPPASRSQGRRGADMAVSPADFTTATATARGSAGPAWRRRAGANGSPVAARCCTA